MEMVPAVPRQPEGLKIPKNAIGLAAIGIVILSLVLIVRKCINNYMEEKEFQPIGGYFGA